MRERLPRLCGEFIAGMEGGTVRPKGRERYKPNTIRSYERVSPGPHRALGG